MAKDLLEQAMDLHRQGRLPQARKAYKRLLKGANAPRGVARLIGALELEAGRVEQALRWTRRALDLDPADAEALGNHCVALHKHGRLEDALDCYERLVARMPQSALAWFNRGHVLKQLRRREEALESYRRATGLETGYAAAHNNIGNLLVEMKRPAEAIEAYRAALAADPAMFEARKNLALSLHSVGRLDAALPMLKEVVTIRPDDVWVLGVILETQQKFADWTGLQVFVDQLRRYSRGEIGGVRPFSLLSLPFGPEEQLQCARAWARHFSSAAASAADGTRGASASPDDPRLHIGYLSADFRVHPVSLLLGEVFALHDREAFRVSAWSIGPDDESEVRRQLQTAFDDFHELGEVDDATAAARIRAAGVDILVDLNGYTHKNRAGILAHRAAPVQVSYFGYAGTSGAPWVDWLVADGFTIPTADERHYSERVARLPGSLMINDRRRPRPAAGTKTACGLPENAFVFCSFNQPYKITPAQFELWMEILRRAPHAVLWLATELEVAQRNLRSAAGSHGVDPERLHFAQRLPTQEEHLARLQAADLFLDTRPYNAHATAVDALWVGVPVLTLAGETFASRVCGSALHAVDLSQLVTHQPDQYVERAVSLAHSPAELEAIRAHLRQVRDGARLFDVPTYTRDLESIYRSAWESHLAQGDD